MNEISKSELSKYSDFSGYVKDNRVYIKLKDGRTIILKEPYDEIRKMSAQGDAFASIIVSVVSES